ncbi:MAG: ATP-binding protein [Desulfobacterales bacterium]|nr:ATP-binding protein [Desulfobacterales bacterium]
MSVNSELYSIIESIPTGVVALDVEGKIVTFNRAAEQITGFKADRVQGKSFDGVFKPDYFQNSELTFKNLAQTEKTTEIKTQFNRKGKNRVHLSLAVSPVAATPEGKIGTVLSLRDITRLNKLEEQANRTGRLAAMGEMAVRIAHEIRNPLGSIELFSTMLEKDLEDYEELKELAEHISSGVKSINNIVSNLLLFIRPDQQPDRQVLDVHEALKDSLFFAGHLLDAQNIIEVETELADQPLPIRGDLELLKQVFLNLILNAIQALSRGGRLRISTRKITRQYNTHWAEIRLSDNGCGIATADLSKIFDPFYTTRNKGTGLGLTIVHNITKMHNGSIDITSCEGDGTECIVTLPLR